MSYYTTSGRKDSLRYGFDIQPYKSPITIKSPPVPTTISSTPSSFDSGLVSFSFSILRKTTAAHAPQPSKTITYNGMEFI